VITPLVIASSALLRSLLEISALSDAELAKSPEFELTGTVTDIDVCSDFSFSDGIGHAFIYRGSAALPRPGDMIVVQGRATVDKDRYRQLHAVKITTTSHGTPPSPIAATLTEATSGTMDYRSARVKGRITDIHRDEFSKDCQLLTMTDGSEMAIIPVFTNECPIAYLNAEVAVTGIVRPVYKGSRIFSTYLIGQSKGSSIEILTHPPKDRFSVEALGDIHHVTPQRISQLGYRRITGRVCAAWGGCHVLVSTDPSSNPPIHVILRKGAALPAYEDTIDAVGFVETDLFNILLTDAEWRPSAQNVSSPAPLADPVVRTTIGSITRTHSKTERETRPSIGQIIEITGTIRRILDDEACIILEDGAAQIEVDASMAPDALRPLQPGSVIRVRGIYQFLAERWRPSPRFPSVYGAQVILRRAEDLDMISRPPWLTTKLLGIALFTSILIAIGIIVWNRILNRIVERRSRALMKERLAHDEAELKKEERTKLAVELHDTLSQNLTGIAFQLDVVELTAADNPKGILPHLRQIRQKMQSCRDNLKNCLWDLRNLAIDNVFLADSLRETLTPVIGQTKISINCPIRNNTLDDSTVHAIVCIVRELAVNAIRHGKATRIDITGQADTSGISLIVKDNGLGFDPDNHPGVAEGHFGLQGVAERVSRLNGEMKVTSSPGEGTEVLILRLHEEN